MRLDNIYKEVAKDTGLSYNEVKEIYEFFWLFIKDRISELPLKTDLSEEEFKSLRTSFNIPYIGKLCCTYKRYLGMKKRLRYLREKFKDENKEDKTNVHKDSCDNG